MCSSQQPVEKSSAKPESIPRLWILEKKYNKTTKLIRINRRFKLKWECNQHWLPLHFPLKYTQKSPPALAVVNVLLKRLTSFSRVQCNVGAASPTILHWRNLFRFQCMFVATPHALRSSTLRWFLFALPFLHSRSHSSHPAFAVFAALWNGRLWILERAWPGWWIATLQYKINIYM